MNLKALRDRPLRADILILLPGYEPSMIYISDHGESLGEHGLYLHGYPNLFAPEVQRHVPMIMWVGRQFDEIDTVSLRARRERPYSHDNVFHTILGLLEIESSVYDPKLDLVKSPAAVAEGPGQDRNPS